MGKLQIVITDTGSNDTKIEETVLSPLGAAVVASQCCTEHEVLGVARDADALIVRYVPITRYVIEHLTRCRIISRYGVGLDMIDLEAAGERGIVVANVADFCVEEVSAHTLCLLLALGRGIFLVDRMMREGIWKVRDLIPPVRRFEGQTLGLVGVGRMGRRVARLAAPLGLRVLGFDIQRSQDCPVVFTDFETVLREADFLSLHCPLTRSTHHLISVREFKMMKPTSFLINVSRGPVVDTEALLRALSDGQIAGAALDVFEEEPLPSDHPLRKMPNIILTPHFAAYSVEAMLQLRREAATNVLEFFQGKRSQG